MSPPPPCSAPHPSPPPPSSGSLAPARTPCWPRLLKYLPPGSSDRQSCLLKQRLLDCECYDITFLCLHFGDASCWQNDKLWAGLSRGAGHHGELIAVHFIAAPSRLRCRALGVDRTRRQPPWLGLLSWFDAVSSQAPPPLPQAGSPSTSKRGSGWSNRMEQGRPPAAMRMVPAAHMAQSCDIPGSVQTHSGINACHTHPPEEAGIFIPFVN